MQSNRRISLTWSTLTVAYLTALTVPLSQAADAARSFKAEGLFRLDHPCPVTGETRGACAGYVIDRIIPPACGGTEDAANMQWQTIAEAKAKDRWERIGCRAGRNLVLPQAANVVTEAFPLQEPEASTEVQPLPLQ